MKRVECRGGIGKSTAGRNGKQDQDHPLGPKYRRTANNRNHQELACSEKVEPARGEECYDPGNVDRKKNGHEDSDPQARRAIPERNDHRRSVSDVSRAVACPRCPQSSGGPLTRACPLPIVSRQGVRMDCPLPHRNVRVVLGGWRRCGTKGWRWFGVGALRSRFWHLAMSSLSTTGLSSM